MATTENGIYYPTDGTQPADVLSDMKKMAESIDETINDNTYDDTKIKEDISKIKEKQETQNKIIEKNAENIEDNATDIQDLKEENANLKAQIPTGTAAGEEISLQDSAKMELVDFGLQGNSKQEIETGKNKAILPDMTKEINGMTVNIKDGVISITGKSNVYYVTYLKIGTAKIESGKTYYLNDFGNKSGSISLYVNETSVWFPDNIGQEKNWQANESGTFNIQIGLGGGESQDWNLKLMICEESGQEWVEGKEPKPTLENQSEVEAVGDSGSVEIVKSNKNILDFGNQTGNGITFNKNRITLNNPTGFLYSTNNNIGGNKFLFGKTLIFSLRANGEITGNNMAQFIVHSNKRQYLVTVNYSKKSYVNAISTVKVTLADDERIGSVQVYTAGTTGNLTIDVQVEIADGATDIIEHEGNTYTIPIQNPFYKIGDFADGFIKQNKWYEQHYIKEVIFTGTENWQLSSNQFRTFYRDIYNTSNGIANINDAATNYFKYQYTPREDIQAFDLANLNAAKNYAAFRVCVSNSSEITTVEEWKAKLQELNTQGNPLKLYYVLNTPELIECTAEQTQILEQIVKDGTFKEVTHFYTTEDLKPTIEVKYYKDLETLFNKQAELESTLNNVQAQLLELGGN